VTHFRDSTLPLSLLLATLSLVWVGCSSTPDDDDSAGDDDDSVGDDDDSAGDDDDSAGDDDDSAAPPTGTAYVVTTDYVDTIISSVAVAGLEVGVTSLSLAAGDVVLSAAGEDLWVLDRSASTGSVYSGGDLGQEPSLEVSFGESANPHHVARCGGYNFVSLYDANGITVLDDVGNTMGFVDVSSYADVDGGAEPDTMVVKGESLWVALQRYDYGTYTNDPVGYLLKVDCATHTVEAEWPVGANPYLRDADTSEDLVLLQTGGWGATDGEIILFDLTAGDGMVIAASENHQDKPLGMGGWAALSDGIVYSVKSAGDGSPENPDTTALLCVDEAGVSRIGNDDLQSNLAGMTSAGNTAWISFRAPWNNPKASYGVAILDEATCSVTTPDSWLNFSLPPSQILVLD
jgi:hypothetical protein